jgi:hypothetical protein
LTDNEYISIPYPVVEGDKQFVVFTFFSRDAVRPDSKQRIYLPRYEAKVAFLSQEISIKELKTNVYKFKLYGEYNFIGNVKILENHAIKTVLAADREYESLLSEVLEKGYLLTNTNDAKQKEIATKIKHDLSILQEKDLAKYDDLNQKCLMDWVQPKLSFKH